jgi:hypothetical protein
MSRNRAPPSPPTVTYPISDESFLRYDSFGSPFITNGCHSIELPPDLLRDTANINFDNLDEIRARSSCRRPCPHRRASVAKRAMLIDRAPLRALSVPLAHW